MKTKITIFTTIVSTLLLIAGVLFYMDIIKIQTNIPKSDKKTFLFQTIKGRVFPLKVSDGKMEIEGMKGKIVFLKIFGWDCHFCQKEIPELINLKKGLNKNFEVIAIEAQNHTIEESRKYVEKYGINYHIVPGNDQKEFYAYLQKKYNWTGIIPLTIVLSRNSDVLAFERGSKSYTLSELFNKSSTEK